MDIYRYVRCRDCKLFTLRNKKYNQGRCDFVYLPNGNDVCCNNVKLKDDVIEADHRSFSGCRLVNAYGLK